MRVPCAAQEGEGVTRAHTHIDDREPHSDSELDQTSTRDRASDSNDWVLLGTRGVRVQVQAAAMIGVAAALPRRDTSYKLHGKLGSWRPQTAFGARETSEGRPNRTHTHSCRRPAGKCPMEPPRSLVPMRAHRYEAQGQRQEPPRESAHVPGPGLGWEGGIRQDQAVAAPPTPFSSTLSQPPLDSGPASAPRGASASAFTGTIRDE